MGSPACICLPRAASSSLAEHEDRVLSGYSGMAVAWGCGNGDCCFSDFRLYRVALVYHVTGFKIQGYVRLPPLFFRLLP